MRRLLPETEELPRVLLASLWHETNTFVAGTTHLADFWRFEGSEVLAMKGDGSQLGAILDSAHELGWGVLPGPCFRAKPSGTVDDDVLTKFESALTRAIQGARIQAMLLFLHGAMVTTSETDVAGRIVETLRRSLGDDVRITVVIDPHANVSARLAHHCDLLLAYRENPHADAVETALRAFRLMDRTLREEIATAVRHARFPVMWPPSGTASADLPMRALLDLAHRAEGGGILAVNVCPGFAHADTPDTGLSVTIAYCAEDVSASELDEIIHSLFQQARVVLRAGFPIEWNLADAVEAALSHGEFPCLLVEPADNVGGGAPGDGVWILRHLLERKAQGSGVILCDPAAVQAVWQTPEGDSLRLTLGGKSSPLAGEPLEVVALVVKKSEGTFTVEDHGSHTVGLLGHNIDMGKTALLHCDGIWILLNSVKTMPVDLGQWRCVGIHPERLQFIGIKAAVAHRRAYDPIAKQSFTVSTPGPCCGDLASLPYRNVRRPVFPLDPLADFRLHEKEPA